MYRNDLQAIEDQLGNHINHLTEVVGRIDECVGTELTVISDCLTLVSDFVFARRLFQLMYIVVRLMLLILMFYKD